MKCAICKQNESIWAWQPFGPGETSLEFSMLGSHYRGFPVIKMCDGCKETAESATHEKPVSFAYKGRSYIWDGQIISKVD
jgi:hypothetical protein